MAQGEEPDGTPTAPPDGEESDPDKHAGPTPTDDAGSPPNADLNVGALSQPTSTDGTELDDRREEAPHETGHDPAPDESSLMGKIGVEGEILAELARAEAKMSDPEGVDDPDAGGAQV